MTERHQVARPMNAWSLRLVFAPALCVVLVASLSGCGHKKIRSVLPQGVLAPVDLEVAAVPDVEIEPLPAPDLAPFPPAPPPVRPPARRRPAPKEETQPAPQVANDAGTATLAIGALTSGGDTSPESQQQARDLIDSILRRIASLPANIANAQKRQIKQVRNFLDQADKALKSGDAVGANNLATKARLLMDDLEKR